MEVESIEGGVPPQHGLSGDDLIWLLDRAPAEVLILRPASTDESLFSGRVGQVRS